MTLILSCLSCLSLDTLRAHRRDAPAAAQGHSEGRIREGQRGGQEPGFSSYRPTETPAVRLTGQCVKCCTGDMNSTQCFLIISIILTRLKFSGMCLQNRS